MPRSNAPQFPGYRFGPNGESAIFNHEDEVPEGWTNNPNDHGNKPRDPAIPPQPPAPSQPQPPVPSKYDGKSKAELVKELEGRQPKITFNKNWAEKKLIKLLEADDTKKGQ